MHYPPHPSNPTTLHHPPHHSFMDSTRPHTSDSPVDRSYQDFEPSSEWVRGQTSNTLLIHLPEFKKEQIKVQVDSYRTLRTCGESPLNGGSNRWSRFRKDFRIPETLSIAGIRAQFENGVLSVVLPKLTTSRSQQDLKPAASVAAEAKPTTLQKATERDSYEQEGSEPVPEARKIAPKTQEQESKVDDRPEEPTNVAGKVDDGVEEPTNVVGKVAEEPTNVAGKVEDSVTTGDGEKKEQLAESGGAAAVRWPEKASWNGEGGMELGTLRKMPNIRQVVIVAVVMMSLGLMIYLNY